LLFSSPHTPSVSVCVARLNPVPLTCKQRTPLLNYSSSPFDMHFLNEGKHLLISF
jgi:hypothetical protein